MGKRKFNRGDEVVPKVGRFKGEKGRVTNYDEFSRMYDVRFGEQYPQYRRFRPTDLETLLNSRWTL